MRILGRRPPEMWLVQTVYSTEETPRAIRRMLVPKEHVVFATRKHIAPLIEPVGTMLLALLAVVYISVKAQDGGLFLNLLWIGWLVLALRALDALWLWWDEWFVLTTGRLIMSYGTIDRKVTIRPLSKVHEWSLTRPFLGQLLGFGHIEMRAHDDVNMKVVRYLPRPTELYHLLDRESLHRQAAGSGTHGVQDEDPWLEKSTAPRRLFRPIRRHETERIALHEGEGRRLRLLPGRRELEDEDDVVADDHRDYFSRNPDWYDDEDDLGGRVDVHGRSDEDADDPLDVFGYDPHNDASPDVHGYDDDGRDSFTDVHGVNDANDDPIQIHGQHYDYPDDGSDDDGSSS